jgi:hypothetical protein
MKLIAMKVTELELEALDQIAGRFHKNNRSAAIHEALTLLFEARKLKPAARRKIRIQRLGITHRTFETPRKPLTTDDSAK